jgi:hypothetical protein
MAADEMYLQKRDCALQGSRIEAGIAVLPADAPVWRVVMEWVAPRAIATCSATLGGHAQLLFSEGSGLAGDTAPGAEPLLQAVALLHDHANGLRHLLKPTAAFPLPKAEHVQFFFRTDAGVLTATARESDLRIRRHRLWRLYFAAHEVATALYDLDELRYSQQG